MPLELQKIRILRCRPVICYKWPVRPGPGVVRLDVKACGNCCGEILIIGGGWPGGTSRELAETLGYSAMHVIRPTVEIFPLVEANMAIAGMQAGEVRHRAALDPAFECGAHG